MKHNYSITIFWLSVISIAIIGYMMLSVQNITHSSYVKNEGITISAENENNVDIINIDIVNQSNAKWGMEIMCDDINKRICEYGSQLCCTSSIYKLFDIYKEPNVLYQTFVEKELYSFDSSNPFSDAPYEYMKYKYNLTYDSPKLQSDINFTSKSIISLIKSGTPVMVRTVHPLIERFWVVIIGVYNGNFVIMDPMSNEYGTLSTYNNKVYEVVYFT